MICWSPEVNTLNLLNLRHYDETFNISRMPHFLLSSLKSWWSPKIPQIIRQVIFKKTLIILHIILHIFYAGINSSMVLKSEQQVMKAKKSNRKKPLISKSKLGNSFSLLRENITDHCSVDDKTQQPEVFGRKFSFSLENFNSLSLQDQTEETVGQSLKVYDTESFKHINVSSRVPAML